MNVVLSKMENHGKSWNNRGMIMKVMLRKMENHGTSRNNRGIIMNKSVNGLFSSHVSSQRNHIISTCWEGYAGAWKLFLTSAMVP